MFFVFNSKALLQTYNWYVFSFLFLLVINKILYYFANCSLFFGLTMNSMQKVRKTFAEYEKRGSSHIVVVQMVLVVVFKVVVGIIEV